MSENENAESAGGATQPSPSAQQEAVTEDAAKPSRGATRQLAMVILLVLLSIGAGAYFTTNEHAYNDLCRALSGQQRKASRIGGGVINFELDNAIVPRQEILSGGPGKDGIPALSKPKFISADEAEFLEPDDRIAGVFIDGQPRAYPLRILVWHENVNDVIGENHFAVVYCPLCDSVSVFDRNRPNGDVLEFGISGLLYNSNVLLYDRSKKESLWSQMQRQSVAGEKVSERLTTLPVVLTSWADWKKQHPDTAVLSTENEFNRDYRSMPYGDYFTSDQLMFPVSYTNPYPQIRDKAKMLCVWTENQSRCYPLQVFQQAGRQQTLQQELDGKQFELTYKPEANSLQINSADEGLEWMYCFWFAWAAFHDNTTVYQAEKLSAAADQKKESLPASKPKQTQADDK